MQAKRPSIASTTSSSGSLLLSKSSDVVKRGCLYVKRPPSKNPVKLRLKTWQKRYLILRDMWTQDGDPVLELYNTELAASNSVDDDTLRRPNDNKACEHCAISLRDVIHVDVYEDSSSFPYAFIVLRSAKSPLIFGAKTDFEMRDWMMAIKLLSDKAARPRPTHTLTVDGTTGHRPGDLRPPPPRVEVRSTLRRDDLVHRSTPLLVESAGTGSLNGRTKRVTRPSPTDSQKEQSISDLDSKFLVMVKRTDDSSLQRLEGEYYMFVSDTEICLRRNPQTTTPDGTAISWPLQHIRKLKSETTNDGQGDLVTLVASSQCGQSQGMYTFRIASGVDLIRRVRMFARRIEAVDSCSKQQQKEMAKLKKAASPSLDKLLSSSLQETGSVGQSMQSLVMSSGSSSGSQLDQQTDDARTSSLSSQSHMYFFTGNSYLPIVDDSGNLAPPGDTLAGKRLMTLSRSMGSLGLLSTTSRRIDSGFESSEEVVALTASPPIPPPRPVHTIGLS